MKNDDNHGFAVEVQLRGGSRVPCAAERATHGSCSSAQEPEEGFFSHEGPVGGAAPAPAQPLPPQAHPPRGGRCALGPCLGSGGGLIGALPSPPAPWMGSWTLGWLNRSFADLPKSLEWPCRQNCRSCWRRETYGRRRPSTRESTGRRALSSPLRSRPWFRPHHRLPVKRQLCPIFSRFTSVYVCLPPAMPHATCCF